MDNTPFEVVDAALRFRLAVSLINRAFPASAAEDRPAFLATVPTPEERSAGLALSFLVPDARWPDTCPSLRVDFGVLGCGMFLELPANQSQDALVLRAAVTLLLAAPVAERPALTVALQAELSSELRAWATRTLLHAPEEEHRRLIFDAGLSIPVVPMPMMTLLRTCAAHSA